MAFGTLGDLNSYRGSQKPTGLPQWLLDQFSPNTTVDEGGTQNTTYSLNNNPLGGFQRDGKYYVQVGQNQLKDPKAVLSDPALGDYTETSNVRDISPAGINYWMLAAALSAGALGTMAGVGAAADTGASLGAGLAGDESAGLLGTGSYAAPSTAGMASGGAGTMTGVAGDESAGLLGTSGGASGSSGGLLGSSGASGGAGAVGNYAPVTDLSTQAAQGAPWYQSLLQSAMNNPLNAARLGMGAYSLINSLHSQNAGASSANGMFPAGQPGSAPTFNPSMQAFQQNPYLLRQMQAVPFMNGSNYVLGR